MSNKWLGTYKTFLIGLVSFLGSSFTYAQSGDQYQAGYYWAMPNPAVKSSTAWGACQDYVPLKWPGSWASTSSYLVSSTQYRCYASTSGYNNWTNITIARYSCGPSDEGQEYCIDPNVQQCPEDGTPYSGNQWFLNVNFPNTTVNVDGCVVTMEYIDVMCTDPGSSWDGYDPSNQCKKMVNVTYTGAASDSETPEPVDVGASQDDPGPPLEPGDHTFDEKSVTEHPTTTTDNGDGSTTETTGNTTIETKNKGLTVDEKPEDTTVMWSEGIQKTTTYTQNCTTQADGAKSCAWEKHVSYEQTDKDLMITKSDDGTTTITTVPGYSGGTTETGTTNYDSSGKQTSSTSTTTGNSTGSGDAEDDFNEETTGTFCEDNPDSMMCKDWEPEGSSDQFDMAGKGSAIDQQWNQLSSTIDQVKGEVEAMFAFSDGTAGLLGCQELFTYNGVSQSFCLSDYQSQLSQIGMAILLISMLIALRAIIGD